MRWRRSGFSLLFLFGAGLTPVAASEPDCLALRQLDIHDNLILDPAERGELAAPWLGGCLDGGRLRLILNAVSQAYVERGYVTTRPYLREQDISDGQVDIEVVIGRIEAIVDAESGTTTSQIRHAFAYAGDILNLHRLEAALETLERVPSVSASFEIKPGQRPGGSVVEIRIRRENPLRIELGANLQTDQDEQLSLAMTLDNPFDINDLLVLRYNSGNVRETLLTDRSRELSYSLPSSTAVVEIVASDIEFEQRVQGLNDSFLSTGETRSSRIRVDQPLARGQAAKTDLAFAIEVRDSKSFFAGELIDVSSYRTSQAQLELHQLWLFTWGHVDTRYRYHKGLEYFGARDDDYYTLDNGFENEAELQFEKFVFDGNLLHRFADGSWQADYRLYWQYSDDILFANDRLNLGSPFTVRGYASALGGSNAWYLRNNLRKRLQASDNPLSGAVKNVTLSIGLDYGEVECEVDNPDLCGEIYALGLEADLADDNFSARLVWGHPLKRLADDIGDEDLFLLDLRWRL